MVENNQNSETEKIKGKLIQNLVIGLIPLSVIEGGIVLEINGCCNDLRFLLYFFTIGVGSLFLPSWDDFFTYFPDSKSTVKGWRKFEKFLDGWIHEILLRDLR